MPIQGVDYKILHDAAREFARTSADNFSPAEMDEFLAVVRNATPDKEVQTISEQAIKEFERNFRHVYLAHRTLLQAKVPELQRDALAQTSIAIRTHMLDLGAAIFANPDADFLGKMSPTTAHDYFALASYSAMRTAGLADAQEAALHLAVAEVFAERSGTLDQACFEGLRVNATFAVNRQTYQKLWNAAVGFANEGDVVAMKKGFDDARHFAQENGVGLNDGAVELDKQLEGYERAVELALGRAKVHARAANIGGMLAEFNNFDNWMKHLPLDSEIYSGWKREKYSEMVDIERMGFANAVPHDWARALGAIVNFKEGSFKALTGALDAVIRDSRSGGGIPVDFARVNKLRQKGYEAEIVRLIGLAEQAARNRASQIRGGTDRETPDDKWKAMDAPLEQAKSLALDAEKLKLNVKSLDDRIARVTNDGRREIIRAIVSSAEERAGRGDVPTSREAIKRANDLAAKWTLPDTIDQNRMKEIEIRACQNGVEAALKETERVAAANVTGSQADVNARYVDTLVTAIDEYIRTGGIKETEDVTRARRRRIDKVVRKVHARAASVFLDTANGLAARHADSTAWVDYMESALRQAQRHALVATFVISPSRVRKIRATGYRGTYDFKMREADRSADFGTKEEVDAALEAAKHYAERGEIPFDKNREAEISKRYHLRAMKVTMDQARLFAQNGMPQVLVNAHLRRARDEALKSGNLILEETLREVRNLAEDNHGARVTPNVEPETRLQHAYRQALRTHDLEDIVEFLEGARAVLSESLRYDDPSEIEASLRSLTASGDTREKLILALNPTARDATFRGAVIRELNGLLDVAAVEFGLLAREKEMRKKSIK